MKEATGELNVTVITVIALVAVGALFYAFVWPSLEAGIKRGSKCQTAYGCATSCNNGVRSCTGYIDESGSQKTEALNCDCK